MVRIFPSHGPHHVVWYHEGGPFIPVTEVDRSGFWSGKIFTLCKRLLPVFITQMFFILMRLMPKTFLFSDRWIFTCCIILGAGVSNPSEKLLVVMDVFPIWSASWQGVTLVSTYGSINVRTFHPVNRGGHLPWIHNVFSFIPPVLNYLSTRVQIQLYFGVLAMMPRCLAFPFSPRRAMWAILVRQSVLTRGSQAGVTLTV